MSIAESPNALAQSPPARPEAGAETVPKASPSLYRVFWRWHFYAGLFVAPVLLVLAVTGALYIFKDEIESVAYSKTMFVEPQASRVPLDDQSKAAKATLPDGYRLVRTWSFAAPERATEFTFQGKDLPLKLVYVNQHTGAVQGEVSEDGFFRVVLKLHRTLLLGSTGRVVVELVTGWTILLLLTGLYLWWPRKGSTAKGVFVPRLDAKPYTVLRDLHTVAGFYLFPVALTIACTGLLYTIVWGQSYSAVARTTGAFAIFSDPPKPTSPADAKPAPLDEIVATARSRYPDADVWGVNVPAKPDAPLTVFAHRKTGPVVTGTLFMDRATGEVLVDHRLDGAPPLEQWRRWNYSLHVGSVLGTPTKILWLVACLVLMALPVTGLWMWWKRRPNGKTGFPRRPAIGVPYWVVGVIVLLGATLPLVGASMVLILLAEWLFRSVGRLRAAPPEPRVA